MNLNGKSKITWWRSGMRTQGREDLGTRNGVTQKLGRVSAWDVGFQNLLLGEDSEEGLYKTEKCLSVSHVLLFATPWTAAHEASLAMDFSRQEYWNGLPFPSPGNLLDSRIEPVSHIAGKFFTTWATREACSIVWLAALSLFLVITLNGPLK